MLNWKGKGRPFFDKVGRNAEFYSFLEGDDLWSEKKVQLEGWLATALGFFSSLLALYIVFFYFCRQIETILARYLLVPKENSWNYAQ